MYSFQFSTDNPTRIIDIVSIVGIMTEDGKPGTGSLILSNNFFDGLDWLLDKAGFYLFESGAIDAIGISDAEKARIRLLAFRLHDIANACEELIDVQPSAELKAAMDELEQGGGTHFSATEDLFKRGKEE